MANKKINSFPTGSISDNNLGVIGDPITGDLTQTSYHAMKDYFIAGITGSSITGSFVTTASFNTFSSSYVGDSSSFNIRIANVYLSESNYLPTSSFNLFSSSYVHDSGSFLSLINSITGSGGGVGIVTFQNYTASTNVQLTNIYASESNYLPTSSYSVDSGSFNARINIISGSITKVLSFIVGDGGPFTPVSGTTLFSASGNPLKNHSIIQFWQEGGVITPVSRSVAWYTFTSSNGIINLNNTVFGQDTYYSIMYI